MPIDGVAVRRHDGSTTEKEGHHDYREHEVEPPWLFGTGEPLPPLPQPRPGLRAARPRPWPRRGRPEPEGYTWRPRPSPSPKWMPPKKPTSSSSAASSAAVRGFGQAPGQFAPSAATAAGGRHRSARASRVLVLRWGDHRGDYRVVKAWVDNSAESSIGLPTC